MRSLIYASVTTLLVAKASAATACPILSGICEKENETYEFLPKGSTPDNPNCDSFICHIDCEDLCQPITSCPTGSKLGKMPAFKDRCGCDHCLNDAGERLDLPYCLRNPRTCGKASDMNCGEGFLVELYHPRGEYGEQPCCPEFHCIKKSSCYHACGHEEVGMDCHCDYNCAKRGDCCLDIDLTCPALVDEMKSEGLWKEMPTPGPSLAPTLKQKAGGGKVGIYSVEDGAIAGLNFPIPYQCSGHCGTFAPSGCWCDESCVLTKDCCPHYHDVCTWFALTHVQPPRPQQVMPHSVLPSAFNKPHPLPIGTPNEASDMPKSQVFGQVFGKSVQFSGCAGGLCGKSGVGVNGLECFCDDQCHAKNDCCWNKVQFCGTAQPAQPAQVAQNGQAAQYAPVVEVEVAQQAQVGTMQLQPEMAANPIPTLSAASTLMCKNNCGGTGWHNGMTCFCDPMCYFKKDCCPDYSISC